MAISSDLIEKMTVAAALGNSKESLGVPLTPAESAFYDRLEAEVRDLQARGMTVEIAAEVPQLVLPGSPG